MPIDAAVAENAKLQYEAGQTPYAMEALSDSGDHKNFTSNASLWSKKSSYAPVVRPDGVVTGGLVTPDDGSVNNVVDISALTCYLAGVLTSVNAGELTMTRGAGAPTKYIINSVTVDSGGSLAVVTGTGNAGGFSTSRGADGGPPYIPAGSIELAQVKFTSEADAVVTDSEIYMVPGTSREPFDYPLWDENNLPAQDGSYDGGSITFHTSLALSHTGDVAKGVYAEYYEPIFAELSTVTDFTPPDQAHSTSSKKIYGSVIASWSSSLNQGSFTAYLRSGISDAVVTLRDEILTFRYYPDRYKSSYILCQGKLGIGRKFPAGDNLVAECTISPIIPAVDQVA